MASIKKLDLKMSGANLPHLLQSTHPKGGKKYLYRHQKTELLAIVTLPHKESLRGEGRDYNPLTFREITLFGYQYKDEYCSFPKQGILVAQELDRMADCKEANEHKKYIFLRLIHLICDVLRNIFSGYGFTSSLGLARDLVKTLKKECPLPEAGKPEVKKVPEAAAPAEVQAKPGPIKGPEVAKPAVLEVKPKPETGPEMTSPAVVEAKPELKTEPEVVLPSIVSVGPEPIIGEKVAKKPEIEITFPSAEPVGPAPSVTTAKPSRPIVKHGTIGKSNAMAQYIHDPAKCPQIYKNIIYKDIKFIEPRYPLRGDDTTSVVGLIKLCSGSESVDLYDERSSRVVIDTLKYCNKETSEQLTAWLSKEKTFNPGLLRRCIAVFLSFDREQKPLSEFALQTLVKIYVDRGWNTLLGEDSLPLMPSNDHFIVNAMSQLIDRAPNDSLIGKWANWMIGQKDFDLETFANWMRIFKRREEVKSVGYPMYYPLRNTLMAYLEGKPEWKSELEKTDLAVYLGLKEPEIVHPKAPVAPKVETVAAKPSALRPKNESPLNASQALKRRVTPGKTSAILDYKQDPKNCSLLHRKIIFQDIKYIVPPTSSFSDESTSVVGLLKTFTESESVNLRNAMSEQVILDVLKYCNKETSEQLAEWLTKDATFHVSLLKNCLPVFLEKEKDQNAYSLFALEILIKHYVAESWNQVKMEGGKPCLPANDKSIVSAISQLIRNQPNDPGVIKLAEWAMAQSEFDIATFLVWIRLFKRREQEKWTGAPILYPLRDTLIAYLQKKADWKEQITTSPGMDDVRTYLNLG